MKSIGWNEANAHLDELMEQVCKDHRPVRIKGKGQSSVVMLALTEYQALEETWYLLRSPQNARRLLLAIEQLAATQQPGQVPAYSPSTTP